MQKSLGKSNLDRFSEKAGYFQHRQKRNIRALSVRWGCWKVLIFILNLILLLSLSSVFNLQTRSRSLVKTSFAMQKQKLTPNLSEVFPPLPTLFHLGSMTDY